MADNKIKITQIKSAIGYRKQAKDTLKALGIKKMNDSVIKVNSPAVNGMVVSISHLIKVEDVK
jgi:large subunit ribosomal protein L30|tara:strand:- start:160 stop:348 length:189 start_codon:yes stop_codon:yes gene_type:complete